MYAHVYCMCFVMCNVMKGNSPLKPLFNWVGLSDDIDIYALAFQECKPSSKEGPETKEEAEMETEIETEMEQVQSPYQNATQTETETDTESERKRQEKEINKQNWSNQRQIEAILSTHLGQNYAKIANFNMWQTRLFVFVKKKHEERISSVTMHYQATGVGGVAKNKGGVAISFHFDGVSMCFVCSHLAAHFSKVQHRNDDYKQLCKGLQVGLPKRQLLSQFHHLFWLGDLNYRVDWQPHKDKPIQHKDDCELEVFEAFQSHVNEHNLDSLLRDDQLITSMSQSKAFIGFQEPVIKFKPTFKVERNSDLNYNVCFTLLFLIYFFHFFNG
ncbi:inositol 5-phosphatase [Reticulomyxa filosa]|uniref:Inositol 5-phosphatase n=1 Tax=Reticulomyxa filosa TaxID=46433 RepID=X6P8N8_RETFI|nr:inositol 5-phosphatase [Reticulomyxa filosa]|eukprot:ETO34875.1 inositol 5-phosphatase [Reticulomyxa filosa]